MVKLGCMSLSPLFPEGNNFLIYNRILPNTTFGKHLPFMYKVEICIPQFPNFRQKAETRSLQATTENLRSLRQAFQVGKNRGDYIKP